MMIRSFIAIELPDAARAMLSEVGQRLQDRVPQGSVRWSKVSGIHLTLQFLGSVAQGDLAQIETVLSHVGQRHAPFALTIGGLGCFPNLKRPHVIWVGVQEETGVLSALQRDVVKSMVPLGFEPERRAFHPHLTLGRTRRDVASADQRQLGESLAGFEVSELARIEVVSFRLMRSDLRPGGAIYTPLAVFDLSAGLGGG
jgi:2'-5' RNA ligase